ncbi:hypothetical protein B0T18DRAFT_164141 [Schizothecium vesticola]|uniref:Uncharacterized protein n=1 Tax=Schizothecium vesticola TaxID=314040 RepID=A0AA40EWW4_9PEZI|nr:hypothetical protein B0T18DRAFT_164141 [Schizothecium vesticola]
MCQPPAPSSSYQTSVPINSVTDGVGKSPLFMNSGTNDGPTAWYSPPPLCVSLNTMGMPSGGDSTRFTSFLPAGHFPTCRRRCKISASLTSSSTTVRSIKTSPTMLSEFYETICSFVTFPRISRTKSRPV